MIGGQILRRSALAPVEIDLRFIPYQHRVPLQGAVTEVFSLPAAERVVALPPETHQGHPRAFEIVHLNVVQSCTEGHVNRVGTRGALFPLIQHKNVVDVKPESVIDFDVKAIDAGVEVKGTLPASAEMIHAQVAGRRSFSPIEEDYQVVAGEQRRSRLIWIVPVIAAPIGDDERRRRGNRRERRCSRWCGRRRNRGRCRLCRRCSHRFLRRRCVGRSGLGFSHLHVIAGLEERGRLVLSVGRVCKHGMRACVQPARADRVEKTCADRAGRVGSAGSEDAAAAAFIAECDQDQAAIRPVLAGNLYIDAGGARGWRNGDSWFTARSLDNGPRRHTDRRAVPRRGAGADHERHQSQKAEPNWREVLDDKPAGGS